LLLARRRPDRRLRRVVLIMTSRWLSIGAEAHRALAISAAYDGPRGDYHRPARPAGLEAGQDSAGERSWAAGTAQSRRQAKPPIPPLFRDDQPEGGALGDLLRQVPALGNVHVLFHIDRYLVRWATRKYKHLRRAPRRAGRTLAAIKKARPGLLAHWRWELRTRLKTARAG
jgi:hypothetical protein